MTLAGHLVSRAMILSVARAQRRALRAPVLCDLVGAGLRGGQGVPGVLRSLGESVEEPGYVRVARELLLGGTWAEAWDPIPESGELLEQSLQPGWEDGIAPTALLAQAARDARRRSASEAREAAEKLAVRLTLPLGGLLLPAFVFLGLVPVFFSLMGSQFAIF